MKDYKYTKRLFDIFWGYILLLLAYLPMLFIALSIYFIDGGPIIFKQIRIGKDGKPFVCYKFRTMRMEAPDNLSTIEFKNAGEYITKTGIFLRKTSLDELPQLLNVLAGDMSIVGPRPLIPKEEKIHKIRKEKGVYNIRPGITGLAQICGRDNLSDSRKIECDIIYTENISFNTDMRILGRTLAKTIRGDGVKMPSTLDTEVPQ